MDLGDQFRFRDSVRSALLLLRSGARRDRLELFPEGKSPSRSQQRTILNALVDQNIVRRIGYGRSTKYELVNLDKIDEILTSEESLVDFIWPNKDLPLIAGLPSNDEPIAQETTPTERQEGSEQWLTRAAAKASGQADSEGELDLSSIVITNQLLADLIGTINASLQLQVFLRDKVVKLEEELEAVKKIAEKLADAWK